MTTEFDRSKVLSRVRKLLTLAHDAGATEGERDNAIRMAHATLAKYNLSLSEVDSAGNLKHADENRVKTEHKTMRHRWMRTVYYGVAQAYFCTYFTIVPTGQSYALHYFVGRESNAISAREIGDFLCKSIQREASRKQRENMESGAYHRSFCNGAASKVFYRCKELMESELRGEEPNAPKQPGTALVLANLYETEKVQNALVLKNMGITLRKGKSGSRSSSGNGYHDGASYGSKVHIGRQIS